MLSGINVRDFPLESDRFLPDGTLDQSKVVDTWLKERCPKEMQERSARMRSRKATHPPYARKWVSHEYPNLVYALWEKCFENSLLLFKALPAARPFYKSPAKRRLIVGSNRAGKTCHACAEIARIVRGYHPRIPRKNGKMLCVGLDEEHIAPNMWEKLTQPGLFKLIPDESTGVPRAVRPDPTNPLVIDPSDMARKSEWYNAPPMIPPEEYDYDGGIVWRDKGKNCPGIVKIRSTGWKMMFYPSGGHPRRGLDVHFAWFDEEVAQTLWFTETMPRLLDHGGSFLWSATPQTDTEELLKLHRRFEAGDPDVAEFALRLDDNPYQSAEDKARLYNDLKDFGDEVLQVRYYGKWGILGRQVYPDFDLRRLGGSFESQSA